MSVTDNQRSAAKFTVLQAIEDAQRILNDDSALRDVLQDIQSSINLSDDDDSDDDSDADDNSSNSGYSLSIGDTEYSSLKERFEDAKRTIETSDKGSARAFLAQAQEYTGGTDTLVYKQLLLAFLYTHGA